MYEVSAHESEDQSYGRTSLDTTHKRRPAFQTLLKVLFILSMIEKNSKTNNIQWKYNGIMEMLLLKLKNLNWCVTDFFYLFKYNNSYTYISNEPITD